MIFSPFFWGGHGMDILDGSVKKESFGDVTCSLQCSGQLGATI